MSNKLNSGDLAVMAHNLVVQFEQFTVCCFKHRKELYIKFCYEVSGALNQDDASTLCRVLFNLFFTNFYEIENVTKEYIRCRGTNQKALDYKKMIYENLKFNLN